MEKRLVILTHMFVRWLTDFGNVVTFMDKEGYSFTIHTNPPANLPYLNWDAPEFYEDFRSVLPAGTDIEFLPYRRGSIDPIGLIKMAWSAIKLGKRHPDGLYMFWSAVIIITMGLPLRLMNRKCLFMVTGLGSVLGDRTAKFRVQRVIILEVYKFLFSGKNSRVLTHNPDDKRFLVERTGVADEKVVVTPGCGADPAFFPFFEKLPDNEVPVILVPARLIVQKGIFDAGEASRLLNERGVKHEMWFTGGFEPFYPSISISREQLDEMSRKSASIKFLGYVESVVPLYQKCDIVLYPTRYPEGVPTVLIESAACGRPAVTTDNVGCRDISIHEQTALVAPINSPAVFADHLERMINDPALRERLRRNAYAKFLAEFTKDIVLQRTIDAFESMGSEFAGKQVAPDIRATERPLYSLR
jgi:glycosyltransferase involved in cell wall biosynthesis